MALQNSLMRSLVRTNQQQWALRTIITSIGGNTAHPPAPLFGPGRTFSRSVCRPNEARERVVAEEAALRKQNHLEEGEEDSQEVARDSPPESHIPWYMQHQAQQQQLDSPQIARQQLPELPDSPPPILGTLLEHVSMELGMDDLSLLDLRQLDPPPALGSNLLMIIGTARSEKHLHVSADRLCRWLRTEYRLSPFADGLLGRNELKLKLRRKAKRARLMSAVGAKSNSEGEPDDGIRTGWVCVNVGRVEGGDLPGQSDKTQTSEGFVGFGTRTAGSNIAVQLMTAEKREEVDLEKLWAGILRKANLERETGESENIEDEGPPELDTPTGTRVPDALDGLQSHGSSHLQPHA